MSEHTAESDAPTPVAFCDCVPEWARPVLHPTDGSRCSHSVAGAPACAICGYTKGHEVECPDRYNVGTDNNPGVQPVAHVYVIPSVKGVTQ